MDQLSKGRRPPDPKGGSGDGRDDDWGKQRGCYYAIEEEGNAGAERNPWKGESEPSVKTTAVQMNQGSGTLEPKTTAGGGDTQMTDHTFQQYQHTKD